MCAILDANVVGQVFSRDRPPAAKAFFDWLQSDRGRMAIGGKLRRELDRNSAFTQWRLQAVLAGRVTLLNDDAVDSKARLLEKQNACRSDDEHVLAVAQISGARLLYTNDENLQRDFKTKTLIDQLRGKVYTTQVRSDLSPTHRRLLADQNLCGRGSR